MNNRANKFKKSFSSIKLLVPIGLIFLTFSNTVSAQDSELDRRDKFTFGAKAGINRSNVWDEKGQDFEADAKTGFAGGIFIGIPFGKYFGFQPELLLSQKGLQGSGSVLGYPYSFSSTTSFIDIPLQLQIKPIEFLTLFAGPQYSYLFHSKTTYTYGTNVVNQEEEFNNDNIRKNILGFVVGADINISHFVISGRAGWDLQTNNGDGSSHTPRYKNQWLQFTLGLKI
jgi:hypothetical protein